jgi:hypothetical protein
MIRMQWSRIAAAAGILAFLMLLVGSFIGGNPPDFAAPSSALVSYYLKNQTSVLLAHTLEALSALLVLVFVVGLSSVLRDKEEEPGMLSGLTVAGAVTMVTLIGAFHALEIGQVGLAKHTDSVMVWTIQNVGYSLAGFSSLAFALFLAAGSLLMVSTGVFPRWIGSLGLVDALAYLVSNLEPVAGPLGLAGFIGYVVFLIWLLATSVMVWRSDVGLQSKTVRDMAAARAASRL